MRSSFSQKGFTLVEMIVSIALFVTVATVSLGALLRVVDANSKSQNIKTSITNLNFALEAMTRELRTGTTYNCYASDSQMPTTLVTPTTQCDPGVSGTWTIAFNSSKTANKSGGGTCKLIYAYRFNASGLYKGEQRTCGGAYEYYPIIYSSANSSDPLVNDSSIVFTTGKVKTVTGTGAQPYVQFQFAGYAGSKVKLRSYFNLQTTVSQRIID